MALWVDGLTYYLVNKEKYCQIRVCLVWVYFTLLNYDHFTLRLKSSNYKSHWNILILSEMFHGKMSDFVSIPLFGFNLLVKLRNFNYESHYNILIFLDKERYGVRFEYVPWKNVWFCFISIAWSRISHKTEEFRF